jgi:uncharacterized delta-60 repeat protein
MVHSQFPKKWGVAGGLSNRSNMTNGANLPDHGTRSVGRLRRAVAQSLETRFLFSTPTFQAAQSYAAGNTPEAVAIADLGNGHPDAIVPNANSNTVSVLLGNGNGTFAPQLIYTVGGFPKALAVADLGNGHPDVVVANESSNTVSILLGIGNGTLQSATSINTGIFPDALAIADLGNGHPDIVVANSTSNTISVFLGNGDGTFQAPQSFPTGIGPDSIAISDLGNGHPDVIVSNGADNTLGVLIGNGDGTFQPQVTYATGNSPSSSLVVTDLGNGHPDALIGNFNDNTVSVFLGNGNGTFQPQQVVNVNGETAGLTTADLTGSGHPDLIVTNYGGNAATVLQGNGDGTFQPALSFSTGTNPIAVAAADLGNGAVDVITANSAGDNISVLINSSVVSPPPSPPPSPVETIGGLDPTFGINGLASHDVGFTSTAAVVVEPDGKSVIAGTAGTAPSQQFGVTRYNADGSLDTSFGSGGVTDSGFGGNDQATASALLANGDILIAGTDTTDSGSRFALAEYTSAGILDTTFGGGTGFVLTSFSKTAGVLTHDTARALVVAGNGTIYVGGSSDAAGKGLDFALAAYNPDGTPLAQFGSSSVALLDYAGADDSINALAVQTNGDIVAAGSSVNPTTQAPEVALARFLTTGAIDAHFGGTAKGKLLTRVRGVDDQASWVAIDKAGKIIVGGLSATGSASDGSLSSDFLLIRYTAAGLIDRTFGGGPVITSFGQPAAITKVLILANGEMIASGKTTGSLTNLDPAQLQVALAQYTTAGKLDTNFNSTGTAIVNLSGTGAPQAAEAARVGSELASFSVPLGLSPADTAGTLLSEFTQFEQSAQGVLAVTQGGELLDVGNSGTNTVEAAIITAGVDLAAKVIAKLPAAALEGAKGTLSVQISENSGDPASGTVKIDLYASPDGQVDTGLTPFLVVPERINLKASQSRTFPVHYTLPATAGKVYLVANVDTGSLHELNANNNAAPTATSVQVAAPFVDLAGSNLISVGAPSAGKSATLSFSVTNSGNILARSTPVSILVTTNGTVASGTQIAEPTLVLSLLPNGLSRNYRLTFKIPSGLPAGTYTFILILDPANTLNDPTSADNILYGSTSFTV